MQRSAGRHSEDASVTGWEGWQGKKERHPHDEVEGLLW